LFSVVFVDLENDVLNGKVRKGKGKEQGSGVSQFEIVQRRRRQVSPRISKKRPSI